MPADHRRSNRAGDVDVAGRDVRYQGPQRVKRRFHANFFLLLDLKLDLVHRDVSRTLDHDLHVVTPSDARQFSKGFQFRELRRVTSVGNRTRSEPVAQRESYVVFSKNAADAFEVLIEKILLMILDHPFRENGAAAAYDSSYAACCQRNVLDQNARVNSHVVYALLCLLLDYFEHQRG